MLKMDEEFLIMLQPNDNVAILTLDGEMRQGLVRHPKQLWNNADAIQELMIFAMKKPASRSGLWLWKIRNNWSEIVGWQYEVK
jgi:hypothetical protein